MLCGKVNDYYEEPIALIGHDGFCEGGQLSLDRYLNLMEALYSTIGHDKNTKPASSSIHTRCVD